MHTYILIYIYIHTQINISIWLVSGTGKNFIYFSMSNLEWVAKFCLTRAALFFISLSLYQTISLEFTIEEPIFFLSLRGHLAIFLAGYMHGKFFSTSPTFLYYKINNFNNINNDNFIITSPVSCLPKILT